ncbi:hypothetical protein L3Y34_019553 [Caenorhabditis briggsae]|uniref:Uncharacterized protein n=1 Tax=Caenorhabditis briggsae TaxID=6238 RepID=A0AAE9DN26_CAEBR|nr:hypothetical protein L3Y34_019553 [Caenorhabditis briggsae]
MPSMAQIYFDQVGNADPDQLDTLFLDNSTTNGRMSGLATRYANLEMLSMVRCGLNTLAGLPDLPSLSYLDISENVLGDRAFFDVLAVKAPQIEKISMTGNVLAMDHLRALKSLPKLSELDLINNSKLGFNYRERVFQMIPSLKILDGCDIDGEEVVDETFGAEDHPEDVTNGAMMPHHHHQEYVHHQNGHHPRLQNLPEDVGGEGGEDEEEEEEDDEYVDVEEVDDSGAAASGHFLDDTAFTYNESAYYNPENSMTTANQQQLQEQQHFEPQMPRGIKRAAAASEIGHEQPEEKKVFEESH